MKLNRDDLEIITSFIRRGREKAAIEYLRIQYGVSLMDAGDIVKEQSRWISMIPSGC